MVFHFEAKGRGKKQKTMSLLRAVRKEEFPIIHRRVCLFVLFRPSTDWMRPTHIREGNLLTLVY